MTPFELFTIKRDTANEDKLVAVYHELVPHLSEADIRQMITDAVTNCDLFVNDTYQVVRRSCGAMYHLSIKRLDQDPIHDWRDLQAIKNELVGSENEAVELYPAESRIVDAANQYHLWVAKDPAYRFPFGFTQSDDCPRMVFDSATAEKVGARQRKL
jgi:hypothetical protein